MGALLSPTDPVLSSAVITNPRVPRLVRHSLNLESGLNDGLALPAVLAFTAAAAGDDDFVWWQFVLQDVLVGVLSGPRGGLRGLAPDAAGAGARPRDQLAPEGALRARRGLRRVRHGDAASRGQRVHRGVRGRDRASASGGPDIRECFEAQSEDIVEIVKLGVFVVFGAIITLDGLFGDGWAAVGDRGVHAAGGPARWRCSPRWPERGRWTRPRRRSWRGSGRRAWPRWRSRCSCSGRPSPEGERIANIAALAVLVSIAAHGLTDHPGSNGSRAGQRKKQVTQTPQSG